MRSREISKFTEIWHLDLSTEAEKYTISYFWIKQAVQIVRNTDRFSLKTCCGVVLKPQQKLYELYELKVQYSYTFLFKTFEGGHHHNQHHHTHKKN